MSDQQDQDQQKEKDFREWAQFMTQDDRLPAMTQGELQDIYNALQQDVTTNPAEDPMPAMASTSTSAQQPTHGYQPHPHNLPSQQLVQMNAPHNTHFWAPPMQEPPNTTPAGEYENTGFNLAPQDPLNDDAVWAPDFGYTAFNPNHTQVPVVGQIQNTGFYTLPQNRFVNGDAFDPVTTTPAVQEIQTASGVPAPRRVQAEPQRWFPPTAPAADDIDTEMQDQAIGVDYEGAEHDAAAEQLPQEYEFLDHIPEEWDIEYQAQQADDRAPADTEAQIPPGDEVRDNIAPLQTSTDQPEAQTIEEDYGDEDPIYSVSARRTTQLAKFGRKRRASSSASEEEYYLWKGKAYLVQGNEPEEWLQNRLPSKKRKVDPMLAESPLAPATTNDAAGLDDEEDDAEPDSPLSEVPDSPSPPPGILEILAPTFKVLGEPDNIIAVAHGDAPVVPYEVLGPADEDQDGVDNGEDGGVDDSDAMDIDD
ncbi:hypothetical protein TI39_contig4202g00041 [Zymoseptoria brevis]|uniref:Uncharacterized protein n=1 Tax=Zymoseptoria brevis TaxID=1047168 RepID=A0A0F4GBG6_9PEZI|nr:hypothetical protein TI39_contig4202g00041 [Zymoseptoria brevis]